MRRVIAIAWRRLSRITTYVVFFAYGAVPAKVRDRILSNPDVLTWMHQGFSAAFVEVGFKLALPRPPYLGNTWTFGRHRVMTPARFRKAHSKSPSDSI